MKVTIEKPEIIVLGFRQEKTDPDYCSCLWARFYMDLTSNDGLKCYDKVRRRTSLLTAELYRRYVDILDKYNPRKYWWLSTPWSTKRHASEYGVLCVSPAGLIFGSDICNIVSGVRPFLILKSSIFVSKSK